MIDKSQAETIAAAHMNDVGAGRTVLVPERTIDEPFGWVFFFESQRSADAHEPSGRATASPPLLVLRQSGEPRILGTDLPVEDYLVAYRDPLHAGAVSLGAILPTPWLRGLAVVWMVSGFLWLASSVSTKMPNGVLMVINGLALLPIGLALVRNTRGMAEAWSRRAALGLYRHPPFMAGTDARDRDRLEGVWHQGLGRQAGAIMIALSVGWVAFGLGVLTGILHR